MVDGKTGASLVNTYFCNVSKELSKDFGPEPSARRLPNTMDSTSSQLPPISETDVRRMLLEVNTAKSSGVTEINSALLKNSHLCLWNNFTTLS